MPRCGGCEGLCRCLLEGSECIEVAGSGQPADPWIASPVISPDTGNSLECRENGLFTGAEIVAGINTGTGIGGDGTEPNPLELAGPAVQVARGALSLGPSAWSVLAWNAPPYDTDGMWDAGSPTRVTFQTDGIYLVTGMVIWTPDPGSQGPFRVEIRLGGVTTLAADDRHTFGFEAGFAPFSSISFSIPLSATNYIEMRVRHVVSTFGVQAAHLRATLIRAAP